MQTTLSFPDWLKRRRRSLDLTRDELARHAHCSASAIRRLERGDLRPSRELAALLAQALAVPPSAQEVFVEFARGHAAAPPDLENYAMPLPTTTQPAPPPAWGDLPAPLTSLVGRKAEVAAVCDLLRQPGVRLLTLTGPPGTGKTRLSLAAAAQLAGNNPFAQGAFFVPLAPVSDPELVGVTIARALGVAETGRSGDGVQSIQKALQEHLRGRQLLLVLDNFEQIVHAAGIVTELLTAVPGLKALVTSREVLHLYGEHEFPVPPLPLPDVNHLPTKTAVAYLARFPSIRLFQERARAVLPGFHLTADNVADVARICAWLDGLPLAIEMAAAHMKWQTPAQVFAQLHSRLASLTDGPRDLSPRQQSLQGAIAWSYNLLNAGQQQVFALLGVFAAGCDLAAIQSVMAQLPAAVKELDNATLVPTLQALVEKSLLAYQATADGNGRYTMLETLREYTQSQLQASHLLESAREAHAQVYSRLAETAAAHISGGGDQAAWLERLELEHHNLRAAFAWITAVPAHAPLALPLAESLYHFWFIRGHLAEGRYWLERALALSDEPTTLRAQVLNRVGQIARVQGDWEQAQAFNEAALSIQQTLHDDIGICRSLESLAILAGTQGDYGRACVLLQQTLDLRRALGDKRLIVSTLNNLAIVQRRLGNLDAAEPLYRECADLCQTANDFRSLSHAWHGLGEINVEQGSPAAGLRFFRQSLTLRQQLGNRPETANSLKAIGKTLYQMEDGLLAVQLLSASRCLSQELGLKSSPSYQAEEEANLAQIRVQMGEAAFTVAWERGQRLSLEEAVQLALAAD